MDLRVQLPGLVVQYASDVDQPRAFVNEGYSDTGRNLVGVANAVRVELAADCRRRFGENAVTVGKKAVTVDGLSGSRADVDLVPAFTLHFLTNDGSGGYNTTEGVMIVSDDGTHTMNFPEQHHANGKSKRLATSHRFKKVVRMLKSLNYELEEHGSIECRVPSFLCECLVYAVPSAFFLPEEDRYDRMRRIC